MAQFMQRSFAGGEISPEIGARADMVKYATGLAECTNFRVLKYGGVQFDPGSYFVAQSQATNYVPRLVEFIFNNDIAYVLEFGNGYVRIIRNGEYVKVGGFPIEVVSPYDNLEVADINYAQSGDVMILVHPNHPPQELKRVSETDWQMNAIAFGSSATPPTSVTATENGTGSGTGFNVIRYHVTAIDDETGNESVVTASNLIQDAPDLSLDYYISLSILGVAGIKEYNIYRAMNGSKPEFIGIAESAGGNATFKDDGLLTNGVYPPTEKLPFEAAGDYPSTVTFYQQRLVFGGTDNKPETVWMSRAGSFYNFNTSTPIQDDDAVTFTIAGRRFNRIRHLVNIGKLIALTSEGEWLVAGDSAGAVTPTSINLQQEGYSGSSKLPPILVGNNALYVQARGSIVRNLVYQLESDGYTGQDLTVFASHLFEKRQLVSWAYQQTPDSIIWCVRDDGKLLGLTYMPEHDVWGWHVHETDGEYEQVCVIPENNIDVVYVVVKRYIDGEYKRYIEVIRDCVEDVINCFHVHSGKTADGTNIDSSITITAINAQEHTYQVKFNVGGANLQANNVGDGFIVGDYRLKIYEVVDTITCKVVASSTIPASMLGSPILEFIRSYDTFEGLLHLKGEVVSVVGDGLVLFNGDPDDERAANFTVSATGTLTLSEPYGIVHIGLPYRGRLKTLRLENINGQTIAANKKIINKVAILYKSSRGIWAGTGFDRMNELKQREVSDSYGVQPLKTELNEMALQSSWENNAVICIEQRYPLALTVLAVSPIGAIGGN